MKLLFSIIFTLVLLSPVMSSSQQLSVSVMDLNVTEGLTGKEVIMLTDKLLNEFVKLGRFKIVERSKRDEILKEQGFQQSGACDQSTCLVEAGQMLGVEKIVGGTIGKMGNVFAVELRMIDIKTGEIDRAFSRQYPGDVSVLLGAMKEAAEELCKWKPKLQVTSLKRNIEYSNITISSKPSGAKILIEGVEVGETPAKLDKIETGELQISLIKYGYQQYDTSVVLGKDLTTNIIATLINNKAQASVSTIAAKVTIDGNGIGESINPIDGSVLIEIPAGIFPMGSKDDQDDEKPVHTVYLDKYYIGKYEVTVGQFKKYCNVTGRTMPEQPSFNNQPDYPVVNVSWEAAKAYCDWAGLRLPTEAEWEKAARGSDGRKYTWGNKWDQSKCNSNGNGDNYPYTSPVSSFPSGVSPYGCFNMIGNVWEWCHDNYDDNYYSSSPPDSNPQGPGIPGFRVYRGGSWGLDYSYCRTGKRNSSETGFGFRDIGFRVAKGKKLWEPKTH
ncbi:SUMF1/EgtB/PvdO family nonheme iron enzyme [candidate division TA06 bacterium]|nr:SUMF1/EgtB/PvdO family nonheme iron enzyme [candidate division TA06 bacterium]